jgi:hypothetical protein
MNWFDGSASRTWIHAPDCSGRPFHLTNDGQINGALNCPEFMTQRTLCRKLKNFELFYNETVPYVSGEDGNIQNRTKTLVHEVTSFDMSHFDSAVSTISMYLPLVTNDPRFCANPFQAQSKFTFQSGNARFYINTSLSFDSMTIPMTIGSPISTPYNALEVSLVGFRSPFYMKPSSCYSVKSGVVGAYDTDIYSSLYASEIGSYASYDSGEVAFPEFLYEQTIGGTTYFFTRINGTYQVKCTYRTDLRPEVKLLTQGEYLALQSLSDSDLCDINIGDVSPPSLRDLGTSSEAIYGVLAMRKPHLESVKILTSYDIDFCNHYSSVSVPFHFVSRLYRRNVGNSTANYMPYFEDTGTKYTEHTVDRHDRVTTPSEYQADYNVLIT